MDLYIFRLINQFALKWPCLDAIGIFFAGYFEYVLVFSLSLFLAVNLQKYWKMAFQAIVAAVVARFIIVDFIRWIFPRLRPFVENNVNLLLYHENEPAFPSGHASFYFAIATIVFLRNKKIGIIFLFSALLISLARIFVGVHWPTDIVVGAAIGIFSGWLINNLSKKFSKAK